MSNKATTPLSVHQTEYTLNAAMVLLIGSDHFFEKLAVLLGDSLPFKWLHIIQYFKDATPVSLGNHPANVAYMRGFENYLNFTYVINPTYRAFQFGEKSGVFLISDFVHDGYEHIIVSADIEIRIEDSEAIGYRTPGWPKNMTEFIVLINLPNGTAVEFTFLIEMDGANLKEHEKGLQSIFPVLNAVLTKQFDINPKSFEHHSCPGQEERFQNFGRDILTEREQEIVQLILIGHNSNSIASKLSVSLSTVKTHRRNIYSKLDISSQAELFSVFLLHLR